MAEVVAEEAEEAEEDPLAVLSPEDRTLLAPVFELGIDRPRADFVAAFIASNKNVEQTIATLLESAPSAAVAGEKDTY